MPFELPPLPGTHTRALGMVSRSDLAFHDLAEVVETDPGLTAALLRAANSAMSSPMTRIETAERALVRIGIERARRIVAGAVVSGNMANLRRAGLDTDELWRHIVATALLADVTAGLLHDIGRIAMAYQRPSDYARVIQAVREGADVLDAEQSVFGADHLQVGVDVALGWNIPEDITAAIGDHHGGGSGSMAWVTWNARRVAWGLGIGDGVSMPEAVTHDPESKDAEIVDALGGPEHFLQQVDWYCGAMTGAAAAAA
ncbi:MAG: HDOD domain-containing protein [Chloroflexi bacterium]|nr:MAG: HDOD domain-containing protein [Chloroflexota bacterium]